MLRATVPAIVAQSLTQGSKERRNYWLVLEPLLTIGILEVGSVVAAFRTTASELDMDPINANQHLERKAVVIVGMT